VYVDGDRLVLSPSDLVGFLQCSDLTELSLEIAQGGPLKAVEVDQEPSVVQRRGSSMRAVISHGSGLRVSTL
jgi:hypothetical protein